MYIFTAVTYQVSAFSCLLPKANRLQLIADSYTWLNLEGLIMRRVLKIILLLLFLVPVPGWCSDLKYVLTAEIDPTNNIISGTARITSESNRNIILKIGHLRNVKTDPYAVLKQSAQLLEIKLLKNRSTQVSFQALTKDLQNAFVDANHVFLWGLWYPQPNSLAIYQLQVQLPMGFEAVSEANAISRETGSTKTHFSFNFNHPVEGVHLAASNRFVIKRDYFRGIEIETCLFKEDIGLADTYLEHAARYLQQYEERLTPYPFRRLAIVANIAPTGIALPTFTLLGKDVIRLPFIVKTSLGHEIMHQWFGNSVYIDATHGNWAEGLTTYLADYETAYQEGRDRAYRKQILVNHAAYVKPHNVIPVSAFQFRLNKAEGTIGYGKVAMFFHQLQIRLGRDIFDAALRDFIHHNLFREASWKDLQQSFENVAGLSLQSTFDKGLNATDLPSLEPSESKVVIENGKPILQIEFQPKSIPYPLMASISVHHGTESQIKKIQIKPDQTRLHIPLDSFPTRVILDEGYHIMRELTENETPAVLASILENASITAVVPSEREKIYQPLLEALGIEKLRIVSPTDMEFADFFSGHFLLAGSDLDFAQMLIGKIESTKSGVRLQVYKNPFDPDGRILVVDVANRSEAKAIQRKLRHYGSYSHLAFTQGRNSLKETNAATNGLLLFDRPTSQAVQPKQIPSLDTILPDLAHKRVIYIGEQHNRYAHHINQLYIIRYLHQNGFKIGVGMEMFKQPYQAIIDDYLADRIDEVTFLKQTRYFEEWGYDYNLYKPIIDYIKLNRIPLVALNLESSITKQVARNGIDSLSPQDKKQIPEKLDFSNRRYAENLENVFNLHQNQESLDDFHHFLQAQVLWDETMAARAFKFLQNNPSKKIIILAGNGHLRHRYGIPDRLKRRGQYSDVVLLQDESFDRDIADYILLPEPIEGTLSPKLGVAIEQNKSGLAIKRVSANSPAQEAGLQTGDIITDFNQHPILSLFDLRLGLYTTSRENTYPIRILRDGVPTDMQIRLFDFNHFSVRK
jgi:uncharacterized iron-regulated protein